MWRISDSEIYCLQDTHWLTEDKKFIKNLWQGECFLNGKKSNSRGVAIMLKRNFEYKANSMKVDNNGNFISVLLTISDLRFRLINIYAPNSDSPDFFEFVKQQIELSEHDHCIMCGDFNLILDRLKDSCNYRHLNNPRARNTVLEIMNTLGFFDAFRYENNDLVRYKWRRKNPFRQARLDYFIISDNLKDWINSCSIKPGYRSDHSIIQLDILMCKFVKGRGLWKFNCSLLKNKDYLIYINNIIDKEKMNYAVPVYNPISISSLSDECINFTITDSQFLEVLLLQIRGETVKFSAMLKKTSCQKESTLVKEIELLESKVNIGNLSELEDKKKDLESICAEKLKGNMIRSLAKWLSEGEKPSRYFCALEKHLYMEKTIRKLVTDDGKVIHDQTKILEEVKTFYQNLVKRRECSEPESYLKDLESLSSLHKLSVTDAESLEGLLTVNEISNSLKQMKNNKCPGIDGFPSEFFKVFWGKLKYFVLRALNESYISGQLSISLRQCIISCLPKGDKPRHLLKNWRPVSLLSVIYKIASSALSARLKSVLEKIISPTQSGFVANRFIGENIRLIYDIMHYTKKENIPGLLMLIDFQKAFDSVSWKFLDSILNFFGFKNSFQRWIKIMNTNIQASVMQCGVLSGLFDIERGCRQGDPLSPYLFLLCAQVLYLMIVNNKDIKGIFIDGREYKLTQFADDTTPLYMIH